MPLAIVLPLFPFLQQLLHLVSNLAQKLLNLPCGTHLAREFTLEHINDTFCNTNHLFGNIFLGANLLCALKQW